MQNNKSNSNIMPDIDNECEKILKLFDDYRIQNKSLITNKNR